MQSHFQFCSLLLALLHEIAFVHPKHYEPCDLARELIHVHKFSRKRIFDWVCLIESESQFDTGAINLANWDNSSDFGLFQINSRYWCAPNGTECDVRCSDLLDDDITDDITCARKVYRVHKFAAWFGWIRHCKDDKAARGHQLLSNCDL